MTDRPADVPTALPGPLSHSSTSPRCRSVRRGSFSDVGRQGSPLAWYSAAQNEIIFLDIWTLQVLL